jgi:hypothetical protein
MIYFGKIRSDGGRGAYADISDGFTTSRVYGRTTDEVASKLRRDGYASVTTLTSKLCRGERVNRLEVETIHKLL